MGKVYDERWETVDDLGEGGQAHTYLVRDRNGAGETLYVLKRLRNLTRLERFKREIEAIRNLNHENIVSLIDFNLEAERPYLVMEYCSGGSLADAEPFWANSPVKALDLFEQICQGVAHAHSNGIVHRDLKPDNIFLEGEMGPAVVGDFGICFIDDDGERLTMTLEQVGPRWFMAPELEDGRTDVITPKSDIYSLGKLLYWLLSGTIFSREKHRIYKYDLRGPYDEFNHWSNVYMEHVNRMLDFMIHEDPDKRRYIHDILHLLPTVRRLVRREYNPIGRENQQRCYYCGIGHYAIEVGDGNPTAVRNFGLSAVGASDWRIWVCNYCGHVQLFRLEKAQVSAKELWEKK